MTGTVYSARRSVNSFRSLASSKVSEARAVEFEVNLPFGER
jgi:hypothetical protein